MHNQPIMIYTVKKYLLDTFYKCFNFFVYANNVIMHLTIYTINFILSLFERYLILLDIIAVGTIGVLQALEALKIILNLPDVTSGRMLLFDAMETKFINIRLRPKNVNCVVCGKQPIIRELIDYEEFCGAKANDKNPNLNLLKKEERITVEEYNRIVKDNSKPHVLVDVRSSEEYQICHLQNSINIPFTAINEDHNLQEIRDSIKKVQKEHPVVNCKNYICNFVVFHRIFIFL